TVGHVARSLGCLQVASLTHPQSTRSFRPAPHFKERLPARSAARAGAMALPLAAAQKPRSYVPRHDSTERSAKDGPTVGRAAAEPPPHFRGGARRASSAEEPRARPRV